MFPSVSIQGFVSSLADFRGLIPSGGRIASSLATIRPQCAGQGHHSSALRKKNPYGVHIYCLARWSANSETQDVYRARFPFSAYLLLPYDDCPEGRALGGCSKLILIPTLPKLNGSLVLPVTLFAPSTAGIVLTGFVTGRNGLRAFFTASIRPLKVFVNTSDP